MLKLFLFGPPRVVFEGVPLEIKRRKSLALLIYLAVSGQPHGRDTLATLFYPDQSQQRARAYLRRDLAELNTGLKNKWLIIDREMATLKREPDLWIDVLAFQKAVAEFQGHGHAPDKICTACLAKLSEAATLYTDDFLTGFTLRDCPEFDEWQYFQTEGLRQNLEISLGRLVQGLYQQGDFETAIPHARRWISLDPLCEPARRLLMQLYYQIGQSQKALRQYDEYAKLLEQELDILPHEETIALYEAIKAKRLPKSIRKIDSPPQSHRAGGAASEAGAETAPPRPVWSEPIAPTPTEEQQLFVARQEELAQLKASLQLALSNRGQIVFVTGEAGRGKTALLTEFAQRSQATYPKLVITSGSCNAYTGGGDPYLPFREVLEQLTGDDEARTVTAPLRQLYPNRLLQIAPVTAQALVELGPDLLSRFVSARPIQDRLSGRTDAVWLTELPELSIRSESKLYAQVQQNVLFEQYAKVVRRVAEHRPLILLLDDMQWIDPGSAGLLFHLGRRLANHSILIVGAYRPAEVTIGRDGERHPLEQVINEFQRQFGKIVLDLSQAKGEPFVNALLDSVPNRLDQPFRKTLYRQTRGHPLFTVELLRGMQERGDLVPDQNGYWVAQPNLDWQTLPARVEGAIGERIGRLDANLHELLRIASVEGEEFTAELVAEILDADRREVVTQLSRELDKKHRLVRALGIRREGPRVLSRYHFRHILIQRYLYHQLDEVERAYLNEEMGQIIERLYGDQTDAVAGQLARHFQEAGRLNKAIAYLLRAGEQARRLSANEEAIAHFTRALSLLETVPDTTDRARKELEVRVALGPALMLLKGHAAPEVEQSYARAYDLCQQIEDPMHEFPLLWGLWRLNHNRAKLKRARELAEQCLRLAQIRQDTGLLVEAHISLGTTLTMLGEFDGATGQFGQGKELYDPQQHHRLPFLYGGFDPQVFCGSYEPLLLWLRGYPDLASQQSNEVLNLAQELSQPYSLSFAMCYTSIQFQFSRDWKTTEDLAEKTIALCSEQGFSTFLNFSIALRGWVMVEKGEKEGIGQISRGLAMYEGTKAGVYVPYLHALLASACLKFGQIDEGVTAQAKAMTLVEETDERFWEAEIRRLKGELLLRKQTVNETRDEPLAAEVCFRKAIDVARQQGARVLELRATVSLCRLWQEQGKKDEAIHSLTEIYNWFTEGFDTVDLKEAKALLIELS